LINSPYPKAEADCSPIAFVFRGQIVAISVATGLIGLILLREWIAQQEWHVRPVVEEEEGEVDPSLWTFRNGQAIRIADLEDSGNAESDRAAAGTDVGDTGDTETIIADGDLEPPAAASLHEDEEHEGDVESATAGTPPLPVDAVDAALEQAQERKPRPALTHASFDASTRVGEATSRSPLWQNNAEAGPSRGVADVPEDALLETPPLSSSHQLDTPRAASGQESPHGTHHSDDFFEALETVSGGASNQTTPEFSPSFRRASDPGPDGNLETPRAERQFGSHGLMDPSLPIIAESPPHTPPLDVQRALDTRMGALLGVPEGHEGPSSPDSVGTPETGEFEHDEQALKRETSPGDFVRTETEDNETDVDADQETDANADAEMEHIEERVEVDEPQWRHFEAALGDDDDGFVVNVEMVQQVMARNELEGVGMEIPPDDDDDRPLDAEDWDGIFEVVGFIGPFTGLLHNVSTSLDRKLTDSTSSSASPWRSP
jgi:hypothetical protein